MPFIGNTPAAVPLTSADIADGIITSAKIVDATITNSDVASSIITGQTAETSIAGGDSVLIYDDSASALRKMTRTNFVSGIGGTNTPNFYAYRTTTDFSVPNNATTTVIFNAENFDTASAYNTTTGEFTVPSGQGGKYLLMSMLYIDNDAARFILIMKKNGNELLYSDGNASSSTPVSNLVSGICSLSAADVITVGCYQNSGGTVSLPNTANGTLQYFCGMKIIE